MDAKSKAEFINSIAAGQMIPCPVCGAQNERGNTFCLACGHRLAEPPAAPAPPAPAAFAGVEGPSSRPPEAPAAAPEPPEDPSAFAQGLPAWDILPPQVVVRRH